MIAKHSSNFMFNQTELKLLEQFAYSEMTDQEFLENYPVDILADKNYLIDLINTATKNEDGENLDLLLDIIVGLEIYKEFDYQSTYRELIKVNWHKMHENLVDSLDKTVPNEDSFTHVLNQVYDYHANGVEDFMVPIWSKCLWNLYAIASEKGIEIIKQYSDSEYEYLRETSKTLMSKING